jgi:uncharacterized protein (TIGR00269 family)
MKCDRCPRDAVIYQQYSGMHLCEDHFTADLEAKAKRDIRKHRWVAPGDRIAVALSGGKDSSALLYFLQKLLGRRRDIDLFAITVDEGICSYRDPSRAEKIAGALGVEWICVSFEEELGTTLDRIVQAKGEGLSCSYCGVLRRWSLNKAARDAGATRLAVGLNLDDEAQSVLMNVLRGDAERLVRPPHIRTGYVQRIKPFRMIPEREVALYALLHVEGFDTARCPYAGNALREEVRDLLNDYTCRHPATKYALVNLGEKLSQMADRAESEMRICERCGEPCGAVCRSCQIVAEMKRDA